ncbi:hypothetical protein LTR10_018654 [Elasticomyces elasticus]|nr:hypothetical protein LTR10_018654 [Elasticomyces elasticus]KAK5186376.1 hypothetical protein LTR44_001432 [Eurotiomycetes sp. CCFEE 6388]
MKLITVIFSFFCFHLIQAIDVGNIPVCAQNCLSNSTSSQTSCAVIDIACLCKNNNYVATAIQFNQQECEAVNESAPNFVGCSPAGLSSVLASLSSETATEAATSAVVSTTTSSMSALNTSFSTITGNVVTETAVATTAKPATAAFSGRPLMTGSCTVPYFAMVTGSNNVATEFPVVGCSDGRSDCCPNQEETNAEITECPSDYFTTSSACCPYGYQVYSTGIGGQTPCYSSLSTTLIPGITPTVSGVTLITDHIFTERYILAPKAARPGGLPIGGLIGIIVNAVLFIFLIIAVIWWRKRRASRAAAAATARASTFPAQEPALITFEEQPTTHELDSPEMQQKSPGAVSRWPSNPASSPPAYESERLVKPMPQKPSVPQELPGSTWINEHHPAYTGSEASTAADPSSPPRTPVQKASGGERRSPVFSEATPRSGTISPSFVSPLGSPRLPQVSP